MFYRISRIGPPFVMCAGLCAGQQVADPAAAESSQSRRILGILPIYLTSPDLQHYTPLSSGEKFKMASEDAVDPGTILSAASVGGENLWSNSNRSFGHGAAGFGRYFGAAYGDLAIGDYMTEAVFPTLLHQDPRYFRRGTGTAWSRVGYALGQLFRTHRDAGGTQFNYSELIGNSVAVGISNAYYANGRTATGAISRLGMQLGFDGFGNLLKEFGQDLESKLQRKHARK
jgi:hypothetical protein